MEPKEFGITTLEELPIRAKELLETYKDYRVFAFYGEMGAGKTTFIKELCKLLNVTDQVNSPTFSIINEYATKDGDLIYHADLYRLKDEEEAFNIGFMDYLSSGNYCFIEWAEKIENLLPSNSVKTVFAIENNKRIIRIHI